MKKNALLKILLAMVVVAGASCSDDDTPNDPAGTVTLNMLNEQNGKTLLGTSDVYINKANNFYSSSCFISDAGSVGGVGTSIEPILGNLVNQVAVTKGHLYQIFDSETVHDFPSGVRAIMTDAAYYRLYVESPITVDNNLTGAIVKYVLVYPDAHNLPKYGHLIGEVQYSGESVSMELPKDAECFWYGGVPEVFDISTDDRILRMTLTRTPTEFNGITGDYRVYIRLGNVFTSVVVRVVR